MKTLVTGYQENGYFLLCTDGCYLLAFTEEPEISNEPLELKGATISTGDVIREMSGKYKAAGYESYSGDGIKYVGTYNDEEKVHKYVLFLDGDNPQPFSMKSEGWNFMYYAFVLMNDGDLFFCNRCGCGRMLQTDIVVKA